MKPNSQIAVDMIAGTLTQQQKDGPKTATVLSSFGKLFDKYPFTVAQSVEGIKVTVDIPDVEIKYEDYPSVKFTGNKISILVNQLFHPSRDNRVYLFSYSHDQKTCYRNRHGQPVSGLTHPHVTGTNSWCVGTAGPLIETFYRIGRVDLVIDQALIPVLNSYNPSSHLAFIGYYFPDGEQRDEILARYEDGEFGEYGDEDYEDDYDDSDEEWHEDDDSVIDPYECDSQLEDEEESDIPF